MRTLDLSILYIRNGCDSFSYYVVGDIKPVNSREYICARTGTMQEELYKLYYYNTDLRIFI